MKPPFKIFVTNLNYTARLPDWLIFFVAMATVKKSGFMILCGMSICIYLPNMSITALTVIELE